MGQSRKTLRRLSASALLGLACTLPARGPADSAAAAAAAGPAAAATLSGGREVAEQCLNGQRWALAGLPIGGEATAALQSRPTLTLVDRDSSEDDGGYYEIQRYRDDEMAVDIVREQIDRLATTATTVVTPWGIRVGMTRPEVAGRLAEYDVIAPAHGDTVDVGDCGAPDAYLTLVFDGAGRLDSLDIQVTRP